MNDTKSRRNRLIIALHAKERHPVEDLASTFRLSAKTIKRIIRSAADLALPSHSESLQRIEAMAMHERVRRLIVGRLS